MRFIKVIMIVGVVLLVSTGVALAGDQLRTRGIRPLIARRAVAHGSGLGRQRWVR